MRSSKSAKLARDLTSGWRRFEVAAFPSKGDGTSGSAAARAPVALQHKSRAEHSSERWQLQMTTLPSAEPEAASQARAMVSWLHGIMAAGQTSRGSREDAPLDDETLRRLYGCCWLCRCGRSSLLRCPRIGLSLCGRCVAPILALLRRSRGALCLLPVCSKKHVSAREAKLCRSRALVPRAARCLW